MSEKEKKPSVFRTLWGSKGSSTVNLRESAGSPVNTPPTSPSVVINDDGRRSPLVTSTDGKKVIAGSPAPQANGPPPGPVSALSYPASPSNPSPPINRRNPSTSALFSTTPTSSSPSSLDASSPGSPSSNPLSTSPTELSLDSPRHSSDDPSFPESSAKILSFVVGAKIKSPPETARTGHTGLLFEDTMCIFGGIGADGTTVTSDFIVFNFGNRSWANLNASTLSAESIPPPARAHHAAIVYESQMIIFGGTDGTSVKNNLYTYSFDTQTWAELIPSDTTVVPPARKQLTMVAGTSSLYVFGGVGDDGEPLSDLYQFNLETKVWTQVTASGTAPSPRFAHGAAMHKDLMWVFGGSNKSSTLDDLYSFNPATNTWATVTAEGTPPSRSGHVIVSFQDSLYVIGGLTGSDQIDIYEFDPEHPTWFKIQASISGAARQGHSAVLHNETIFLFGGIPATSGEAAGSLDYLCIGKDDFEEDLLQEAAQDEELLRIQSLPRSVWEATLLKKHSEILELRERARIITNGVSYARKTDASATENRVHLNHQVILQLAMEYLASIGYYRTVRAIQEESKVVYHHTNGEEPSFMSLLRLIAPQINKKQVFEPEMVLNNAKPAEGDAEVQVVDHIPGRTDTDAEDVNIWDEPADSRRNIIKGKEEGGKKSIRAASLNKLIQYLTSEKDKAHDLNMKNFLYTYQSFMTPEQLLKKLIQRYMVPVPKGVVVDDKYRSDHIEPIQTRVCNVIKFWIEKCDWDFNGPTSEKLLANLNAFIDGPLSRDGNLTLVKQLRNSITKCMKKKTSPEEDKPSYVYGTNPPEPKVPKNIFSSTLALKDLDELEIARQLTLIDFNIFSAITPVEFLNRSWENTGSKRSSHLTRLLIRADDIRRWVVFNIVNHDNKKTRGRMIEKYVKTAEHLRGLKNFQSMFAVVAGLSTLAVSRLSQSLAEVPPRTKEIFQELLVFTNREGNYKHYREALRSASLPTIPLLDAILLDVLAIEDGNPAVINNLINFQKRQLLYSAITKMQSFQQRPFNLQPVFQIAENFLTKLPKTTDKELDELSHKCEQ